MNHKKLKHQLNNKPVSLTPKEITKLKQDATMNAIKITNLMPLLVLHDEFGFGKKRLLRYLERYSETVDAFNTGHLDLKDVHKVILDEAKIDVGGVL